MSLSDALRGLLGNHPTYRDVTFTDATVSAVLGMSAEQLWRTQPHLRTVVSFVARNIAQLGLHTFERVSETDRRRVRDDAVAMTLARPNPTQSGHELIYGLVADYKLYDLAVWLVAKSPDAASGWQIWPISPSWVTSTGGGTAWAPAWVDVQRPGAPRPVRIDAENLLIFHGWNPGNPAAGSSPVDALRGVLAEQIHANAYRQQVWQRGGRVGAVLVRPANAPGWSEPARERFAADWRAKWTGNDGPKAGGTPILEDGMDLKRIGFSAKEDEWVEGAKLSLSTVASVYHINPTMVGVLDNANFSNVREFRRMLYGDSLGPDLAMIEDRINTFLVPRMTNRDGVYVEFNIAEKMQGSFEEQTSALQSSIGRPWMTANEGRALLNMPSLNGDADSLVTPLNVLVGGQASPRDSAPKALTLNMVGGVKARVPQTYTTKAEQVLAAFFTRQAGAVKSRLGAKAAADWWDDERWDKELADDLYALAMMVSAKAATETLEAIGFGPDEYDRDRTEKFLRAVSERVAGGINAVTKAGVAAALAGEEPASGVDRVFTVATGARAAQGATSAVTQFSGFGTTEAVKQVVGDRATKTWVTTSSNTRSSHARMNGETVPVGERFSNGAEFPGDSGALDADETAGCECDLRINVA